MQQQEKVSWVGMTIHLSLALMQKTIHAQFVFLFFESHSSQIAVGNTSVVCVSN